MYPMFVQICVQLKLNKFWEGSHKLEANCEFKKGYKRIYESKMLVQNKMKT